MLLNRFGAEDSLSSALPIMLPHINTQLAEDTLLLATIVAYFCKMYQPFWPHTPFYTQEYNA